MLRPDHPGASELGCAQLENGLLVAVATLNTPFAHLIGSDHALRARLTSKELIRLATANLVRTVTEGTLPTAKRTIGDMHALAIGPHVLASSCLLLPDLQLWAQDVIESTGPLTAVPLRRELLLVIPEGVSVPPNTWAPALRLT